jgi:preprotein translocase subunit YajC
VVTNGGIHGIIAGLEDKTALLQVSENVKIKVERSAITTILPKKGE